MLLSTLLLADWSGDVTKFRGFNGVLPVGSPLDGAEWISVVHSIAPKDEPVLKEEKKDVPYFVPCLLKEAPLTEWGKKLTGKATGMQRSATHVTAACMVIADLDGITKAQLAGIEQKLHDEGLTYLLYSSYSFGHQDKPGTRCRLVMPVDQSLDTAAYHAAAQGLNILLLNGLADPSGFALHQLQGVWATSPERASLAFRTMHKAGVCSASALIAAAPKVKPKPFCVNATGNAKAHFDEERVVAALKWLDPNDYKTWTDCAIWLKAAYGEKAYPAWLAWSEAADEVFKAYNDEQYAPDKVWAGLTPRLGAEVGVATLLSRARDAVVEVIRKTNALGVWDSRARDALVYLKRFHSKKFAELFEVAS